MTDGKIRAANCSASNLRLLGSRSWELQRRRGSLAPLRRTRPLLRLCAGGRGGARPRPPRRSPALFLSAQQAASAAGLFTEGRSVGQGRALTRPLSGVAWRRPGCTGRREGVPAWRRLCPHSNLRSEVTVQCPPLFLHPHLRAPLWVRNLQPTPMCMNSVKGSSAQRQGNGPNVPRLPD